MIKQIFEKSFTREESIRILREGVANKSFQCYHISDEEAGCEYVNSNLKCCAVGLLMRLTDDEVREVQNADICDDYDVKPLNRYPISALMDTLKLKEAFGFTCDELQTLQTKHDDIASFVGNPESQATRIQFFEDYIMSLK